MVHRIGNVKPLHVYQMFHALPAHINKHLFFHNGAHVYMNNWQSIDFRESMNALFTKKLLGQDTDFQLPTVIWQDNTALRLGYHLIPSVSKRTLKPSHLVKKSKLFKTNTQIKILSVMVRLTRPSIQNFIKGKSIRLLLTFL